MPGSISYDVGGKAGQRKRALDLATLKDRQSENLIPGKQTE